MSRASVVGKFAASLLFALQALPGAAARAEDRVHLLREGALRPIVQSGTVLEFTGRMLRFQPLSGNVRDEPASRVVRIETEYPPKFDEGRDLLAGGEFEAADAAFARALEVEHRAWVQRDIRTWRIRADWRRGDWSSAGEEFLKIVRQDPDTPHWSMAPLLWTPHTLSESDRAAAQRWFEDPEAAPRLLGASVLLHDAARGEEAAGQLDVLARDAAPFVAALARAQQWRTRPPAALSDGELESWRGAIGHLPRAQRGGPQYLLGRACAQRADYELAASELLWTGLIYTEHEPTTARALFDAAEALDRLGRTDEADRLRVRLGEQFPWSAESRERTARAAPPRD